MLHKKLLFSMAFIAVGSTFAMEEEEAFSQSIIEPIQALQKTVLSKDIQTYILSLYLDKYFSEETEPIFMVKKLFF